MYITSAIREPITAVQK